MCSRIRDVADGILNVPDGHMHAAQAKWDRLTEADLTSVRNKQDLILRVEERYSLSHAVAVQDVDLWDVGVRRKRNRRTAP